MVLRSKIRRAHLQSHFVFFEEKKMTKSSLPALLTWTCLHHPKVAQDSFPSKWWGQYLDLNSIAWASTKRRYDKMTSLWSCYMTKFQDLSWSRGTRNTCTSNCFGSAGQSCRELIKIWTKYCHSFDCQINSGNFELNLNIFLWTKLYNYTISDPYIKLCPSKRCKINP